MRVGDIRALTGLNVYSHRPIGQPGAFALVTLGLPHPLAQGLRGTADLAGDRDDCRPLRFVLCLALAAIINNHIGA